MVDADEREYDGFFGPSTSTGEHMKTLVAFISTVSAAALVCGASYALQEKTPPPKGTAQEAAMTKPKPTKEHEWLKNRIGTWEATVSCPMMGEPTKGTETTKAFGEFTIQSEFSGTMMGEAFTGLSLMTYDPIKKKYVSTWCDTVMPAIFVQEGTMDASGKKLTCSGKGANMEGAVVDHTSVLEVTGPDSATFTMYESSKGANDPSAMRIEYKRKK
jgi:hypothetical protein